MTLIKDEQLKKIFQYQNGRRTTNFLEEQQLIEYLLEEFNSRALGGNIITSQNQTILEGVLKEALASKNTRNIVNSNLKMIESNEKLSKSNEKYQKSLNWLTGALVIVGLIQIGIQIRKN